MTPTNDKPMTKHGQTNGQTIAQSLTNPMANQCGRGKHVSVRQGGNDNKMMVIDVSPPASPLQNLVLTLVRN